MADVAALLEQVKDVEFEKDWPGLRCHVPPPAALGSYRDLAGLKPPVSHFAWPTPLMEGLRDGWLDEDDVPIFETVAVVEASGYTFLDGTWHGGRELLLVHEGRVERLPLTELDLDPLMSMRRFDPVVESGLAPSFGGFWPVADSFEHATLGDWAVKVRGIPVIPARMEGYLGFVLVGAGDLTYEIAEAFIRVGYHPPASLLPLPNAEPETARERLIALALWRSVRSLAQASTAAQVRLEATLAITTTEERILLP
jgi:hypothetical protein